jgi:hypothetical protein
MSIVQCVAAEEFPIVLSMMCAPEVEIYGQTYESEAIVTFLRIHKVKRSQMGANIRSSYRI